MLADVDNRMRVAQEEIFGPVAAVIPFEGEEEAVRVADDIPYGLSGWIRDLGRAIRVARGIRTGVISVNSSHSVHTEAPFGGYKKSGIGREMGCTRPSSTRRSRTSSSPRSRTSAEGRTG